MIFLYRFLTTVLYPLFIIIIYFKKFIGKEHQNRFKEKIFFNTTKFNKENGKKVLWFHAASIGEVQSIFPIIDSINKKNRLLGINPGAKYGSSKRWYPKKFADVATSLSSQYDIVIFGGPGEREIAKDIEQYLIKNGISNYQNLAAQITIKELVSKIASLDLFITGDSGPMHLAAACQIPTVAIFGPTKDVETSQWMNDKDSIVKKNLKCQPCMKRVCPLKHHNCMKLVEVSDVLKAVKNLN